MKKHLILIMFLVTVVGFVYCQSNTVVKPKSNETLCKGEKYTIEWNGANLGSFVEIYLKTPGGKKNVEVLAEHTKNDGKFECTIPSYISDGKYLIRVVSVDNHNLYINSGVFEVIKCLKRVKKPVHLKPINIVRPKPVKPVPLYSKLDHGDVEILSIRIEYGQNIKNIPQGGSVGINVPEDSDLLDSNGNIPAVVKYTLRNKTGKNFRFDEMLRYNNLTLASSSFKIILLRYKTKSVTHNVVLKNNPQLKRISVECPEIGISDDTRIVFFNARLSIHIYAL